MILLPLAWHKDMHHYKHKDVKDLDKLWFICTVFNPVRYNSRYRLLHQFKEMVEKAGANLFIVEVAFGDRSFECTKADNKNHLQLRTKDEIWLKEVSQNCAVAKLPLDWKYICFLDADIEFVRKDWIEEIVHQLQHYKIVQVFRQAIDLGPNAEVLKVHNGFVWSYLNHKPLPNNNNYPHLHPGYGWGYTREAFNQIGGLLDFAILGSADHHMAYGLINKIIEYAPKGISDSYKKQLLIWQERCNVHIKQDIGYIDGTILHHFHGSKASRNYCGRWEILLKHKYSPDEDIKRDWQNLWQFSAKGERMKNDIREYFRQRQEDSILV